MNLARIRLPIALMSLLALPSFAQISPIAGNPSSPATVEGIVFKDPGSEPVKKAVIELIAENQSAGGNYTAVTNADGIFRIEQIAPGRYHLFAERTGYVEGTRRGNHGQGRILTLAAGQDLKDIQIRLAAAATVTGRVTDEDGDPLENAEVSVLRRTFVSGRARWQQIGSERTNDLGEYRISSLPSGNYYISVNPPPDFKTLLDSGNSPSGERTNNTEKPSTCYPTAYYPGTTDRRNAEPIPLHAGDEFPANFSLVPSPTLTIRGSVANLPPRASATILLQANDFNVVLSGAEVHKDGGFVLYDVAPGAYTIVASVDNAPVPMIARQSLQVTSNNIDSLRLVPQAGATIRGKLHVEGKTAGPLNASPMALVLHPSDGQSDIVLKLATGIDFSPVAEIAPDGSFEWSSVQPGNYSLRLDGERNPASDWFLKSAIVGGHTTDLSEISVDGGVIALDVIASANGGVVEGIVTDPRGQPVADAVIIAAPEVSERSRDDHFHKTASDQNGRFSLHGIAPGQYSLFAWDHVEGDAYYDPEFLRNYQQQATSLEISENDRKNLQLRVIPTSEDSQ
jgi:protocatechuate 3,4-dioxygenase beta subunit